MRGGRRLAAVIVFFAAVALVQAWPLPLALGTRVTGPVGGDTGVYAWNPWVFRHELLAGHFPFRTTTILALAGPADLSLHNYTVFADLLALPLQSVMSLVSAFNAVYLVNVALCGIGMYLLARRVTGREAESWLAGALFAWSPFLVARGGAHFSLAAAAPLPVFLYAFDRAWDTRRTGAAIAAGATVAWAGYCDPYYAIYCAMMAAAIAAHHLFDVSWQRVEPPRARPILDAVIALLVLAIVLVHVLAGGALTLGGLTIAMRSLYTPVLVVTALVAARWWLTHRVALTWIPDRAPWQLTRTGAIVAASGLLLLSPELFALASRSVHGRMVSAPVLWRSSAPGLDLATFFAPNPNHPFAPRALVAWIGAQPGRFEENVASVSLVGLVVMAAAARVAGWRPDRFWLALTLGFAWIALGPFVRIAGIPTFIPTPWTFLRYVPVIGTARMPPRFDAVVTVGVCVLFASALAALRARMGRHGRLLFAVVAAAALFEWLPAPRTLYSADIPGIARTIAADPRPIRILELPFGIRDGLSSLGDFTAASQLYQTVHGKALVGGYLSRVDDDTKALYQQIPFTSVLLDVSEHKPVAAERMEAARQTGRAFADAADLGYVIVDAPRVAPGVQTFVVDSLGLTKIGESGGYQLFKVERSGG